MAFVNINAVYFYRSSIKARLFNNERFTALNIFIIGAKN